MNKSWIGISLLIISSLIIFYILTESYVSIEHQPEYSWPGDSVHVSPLDITARFEIRPSEIYGNTKTLCPSNFSFLFSTDLRSEKDPSFKLWLVWSTKNLLVKEEAFPRMLSDNTREWNSTRRQIFLEPYCGSIGYLKGRLLHEGISPWEKYSLKFVFGFNRTDMKLVSLHSDIYLSLDEEKQWRVIQEHEYLGTSPEKAFRSLGFSEEDMDELPINDYSDYYQLKISFIRQPDVIYKGLIFWIFALVVAVFLIIAGMKVRYLDSNKVMIFVAAGFGLFSPIWFWFQSMPQGSSMHIIIVFFIEIVFAFALAIFILNNQPVLERRKRLVENVYAPLLGYLTQTQERLESFQTIDLEQFVTIKNHGMFFIIDERLKKISDQLFQSLKEYIDGHSTINARSSRIIRQLIEMMFREIKELDVYRKRGYEVNYSAFIDNQFMSSVNLRDCLFIGKLPTELLHEKHSLINESNIYTSISGYKVEKPVVDALSKLAIDLADADILIQEVRSKRMSLLMKYGELRKILKDLV